MGSKTPFSYRPRSIALGAGLTLAFALMFLLVQTMTASNAALDLGIRKAVDRAEAASGQTINYTVVISNNSISTIPSVAVSDTLPLSVTYKPGSLSVTTNQAISIGSGDNNGKITWTGSIGPQGYVTLTFGAVLTDSLPGGVDITNTAYVTGTGNMLSDSATTTVVTSTTYFMPVIIQPVPIPVLYNIARSMSNNQWTVNWSDVNIPQLTEYQLQEDSDLNFASPSTYNVGTANSRGFSPNASISNVYCYRVRALTSALTGAWSNAQCVHGDYRDNFNNSGSGWKIRREDTDDADNESYYQNGRFVVKIHGRWDYAIAAPMVQAPWPSYQLETKVKFEGGVDNLHTYGIVFGGDWNGQQCPNNDYSSCFNHYYRLMVMWFGSATDELRFDLKRIDSHDPKTNAGNGHTKLISWLNFEVPDDSGWNTITVIVRANGEIKVKANGVTVGSGIDTRYLNDPYFGVFAASNEYSGTEPWFEYFSASPIP